jgi:translation elongation factor EF-G
MSRAARLSGAGFDFVEAMAGGAHFGSGDGRGCTIEAMVPMSELARYGVDLRSLTGGRGRFTASHDHHDVLPSHLAAAVGGAAGG